MAWKKATKNFPLSVNWEETEIIEGTILKIDAIGTVNGMRNVMSIDTDDSKVAVWESAGLNTLFALTVGTKVRITNEGMKLNEKTQRRFRSFCVEYDDEHSDIPEAEAF